MKTYAEGLADGWAAGKEDKANRRYRTVVHTDGSEYEEGYRDGYNAVDNTPTPRRTTLSNANTVACVVPKLLGGIAAFIVDGYPRYDRESLLGWVRRELHENQLCPEVVEHIDTFLQDPPEDHKPMVDWVREQLNEAINMPLYAAQLMPKQDMYDRLPRACASTNPVGNGPVLLKRGQMGYLELHPATDVDRFNREHGITEAQRKAMEAGSMFGWGIPGADPATYEGE